MTGLECLRGPARGASSFICTHRLGVGRFAAQALRAVKEYRRVHTGSSSVLFRVSYDPAIAYKFGTQFGTQPAGAEFLSLRPLKRGRKRPAPTHKGFSNGRL